MPFLVQFQYVLPSRVSARCELGSKTLISLFSQYYYSDSSPNYYESGSESPVAQQLQLSGESWSPTATNDNRNDYSQPRQSSDLVANLLEVHDAEVCTCHNFDNPAFNIPLSDLQDVGYPNYTGPSYPLSSTSLQDPGVGTDATHTTYTNVESLLPLDLHSLMIPLNIQDAIPYHPFANLPFYPYPEFDHGHSQHQLGYTPHGPVHYHTQPLVHDAHQYPAQDIHNSPRSQDLIAHTYPGSSSTQLLSPSHGGPVHRTDTRSARLTPDSSTQDGVSTARTADAGQHSHQFPVANSPSNQTSAPGPSRPWPSSPEKKRLLPLTATDEHTVSAVCNPCATVQLTQKQTTRRVVPRHDRASGVHSTSSHPPRPGPSSRDVYGRGPLIPQERYITSTISSYSAPDQHSSITFDLENPDQIGIPIIDILNKTGGFARIRDRTQAFSQEGKKTFTLRVQVSSSDLIGEFLCR